MSVFMSVFMHAGVRRGSGKHTRSSREQRVRALRRGAMVDDAVLIGYAVCSTSFRLLAAASRPYVHTMYPLHFFCASYLNTSYIYMMEATVMYYCWMITDWPPSTVITVRTRLFSHIHTVQNNANTYCCEVSNFHCKVCMKRSSFNSPLP
jgi:hypothetical protein